MSIVDRNASGDSSGLKQLDELIKLLLCFAAARP